MRTPSTFPLIRESPTKTSLTNLSMSQLSLHLVRHLFVSGTASEDDVLLDHDGA
jgi:hypothetical protein